jgi:hypothetical protein
MSARRHDGGAVVRQASDFITANRGTLFAQYVQED